MPSPERTARHQRPNWHVDAKWVSGLLLFAVWSASLALLALYMITQPEPAINLAGGMLSAMTSNRSEPSGDSSSPEQETTDREQDLAAFLAEVEAAGPDGLRPFPGVDAVIRIEDIPGRTAEEVSLMLFKQVAEQVYWNGAAAVRARGEGSSALSTLGLMALFTNETHLRIESLLQPFLGAGLILLALLVFFSTGPGRLLSPGLVLTLSSSPGVLAAVFAISRLSDPLSTGGDSPALLSGLQATLGPSAVTAIEIGLRGYLYSLSAGLILLALGLTFALGRFFRRKVGAPA